MSFPDATVTNAITNAIHASCLLAYFIGARRARFPSAVTWLFFLLFVLKIMGVYVHHAPETPGAVAMWAVIAIATVLMNFIVLREAEVTPRATAIVLGLCVASTAYFLTGIGDFGFIALPAALVFGVAAKSAPAGSKLRLGLMLVVISNLVWFVSRKVGIAIAGGVLPVAYRYDNDIYHFLLIAATFTIYKGFANRQRERNIA